MHQLRSVVLFVHLYLWVLQQEVEVDGVLAGHGDKLVGKPNLRQVCHRQAQEGRAHLVSQHGVELIEDVLAEAGSMDGDSSSTPTDVARGDICHYSSTVAMAWG